MDIRSLVRDSGGEQGLLGLAFHPSFETNRRLFVYYTRNDGDIVVARYLTNAAGTARPPDPARTSSPSITARERTTTAARWPSGRTAMLYFGTGDGGGRTIQIATPRARPRTCSARSCASTSTGPAPARTTATRIPSTNPFRGSIVGPRRDLGVRPAQPVADLLRPRDRRAVHRRRRPEPLRGDQPRARRLSRRPKLRLGRRWRASTASDSRLLAVGRHVAGRGVRPLRRLLDHRRLRLPRHDQPKLVGSYFFADFCSGRIWSMAANGSSLSPPRYGPEHHLVRRGRGRGVVRVTIDGHLYQVKRSRAGPTGRTIRQRCRSTWTTLRRRRSGAKSSTRCCRS